jgi:hypothetical protein
MTRHIICMLTLFTATAAAQEPRRYDLKVTPDEVALMHDKAQLEGKLRVAIEMKTTVGAPYSGEATTEAVQALADGNRIVRRSIVRIYRDSEGRVRRENVSADGRVESVTIVDPVSGSHVVLDPEKKLAFGDTPKPVEIFDALAERRKIQESAARTAPMADGEKRQVEMAMRGAPRVPAPSEMPRRRSPGPDGSSGQTSREDLGQRTIEGVAARGSRTTTVLPAGAIGNEQPLRIVSEEWFAPDLQVLLLTKHSDPRSGDTTYTLSNINRGEPDRSLFEVPADYVRAVRKPRE